MANLFGVFGPQAFVVLVVAVVGLVPIALYYEETPKVFVVPYVFLGVAAFATNFENVVLPNFLNYTEHFVGNLGAGLAFAGAAYVYRERSIVGEEGESTAGGEGKSTAGGDGTGSGAGGTNDGVSTAEPGD